MIKIKKRSKTKVILLVAVPLLVIAGGLAVYFSQTNKQAVIGAAKTSVEKERRVNVVNTDKPTSGEIKAGKDIKKETIIGSSGSDSAGSNTGAANPIAVTISAANQNGEVLQIRAFGDIVTNGGLCQLTLTKGSNSITKSAPTQAAANISTCQGFDIPMSELSSGTWELKVIVSDGSRSGTAIKKIELT